MVIKLLLKIYNVIVYMKEKYSKQILLIISIIVVSVTLHYCSHDDTALTSTTYLYIFSAIVPLLLIFIFAFKKGGILGDPFNIYLIGTILVFVLLYSLITFVYSHLNNSTLFSVTLLFFLIICGLAIFYKMYVKNILRLEGTPKLIASFLFYIPRLLNDFIIWMKNGFITAPRLACSLLILEIIFVALIYIGRKFLGQNEIIIYKGKFFFDTREVINVALQGKPSTPLLYSLSLWIHINQPEINDIEFPILLYGDHDNPKPQIIYKQDKETGDNILNIKLSGIKNGQKSTNVSVVIEHQKWNHLVFNYNGSIADIFLNGLLHKTINLSKNLPEHHLRDTITIGSQKLILNGSIADITYNTCPLSSYQILAKYRLGINTINL
jgi:Concanavalin A-like lectin/glucanases superfamily